MLILVDLFEFDIIVAPELRAASPHGVGDFQQIVAEIAVPDLIIRECSASNSPDWSLCQTRPANFVTEAWESKRWISPISAMIPAE